MHARGGSQWQSRRKASLGPLRRAHPASGATWNVQVVRGKMTSRCLWHACRALVLGMVLMAVGGGMATVGYYANNFPSLSDLRSNSSTSTIRVKNEHRGLHLNNLSYVGPIIMGVGGFIVVASCVMTFEARDSAAKVVPARFKLSSQSNRNPSRQNTSRRSTGVGNGTGPGLITAAQTARWEQHLGVFRTSPATEQVPDRKALTAALVHFSKALGTPKSSPQQRRPSEGANRRVSRSGSVPNLYGDKLSVPSLASGSPANNIRSELLGGSGQHRQHHHHHQQQHQHQQHPHHRGTRVSSMVQRSTRGEVAGSGGLLHPGMLQFHRHALSVDEPDPFVRTLHQAGSHGSVQYGCSGGEIVPVHKLREQRTKRSDTARRHVLSRQTKIEKDELVLGGGSPKQATHHHHHQQQQQQQQPPAAISRRASTVSNASVGSKQLNRGSRRASTISKTPSVDSRGAPSTLEINSPERSVGLTPRKGGGGAGTGGSAIISTPSVDRECRSQLSICSEPAQLSQRNLSCQSSLEPCVPEEDSPDHDESTEPVSVVNQPLRPDSLVLAAGDTTEHAPAQPQNRFLYRSNSTKSFRKPKPKIAAKKRSNEYDQIYVIGAGTSVTGNNRFPNFYHHRDDDHYDSIEVIHERRSKNFSKFSDNPVTATNTEASAVPLTSEGPVGTADVTTESPTVITDSSGEYRKVGSNTISVVADISPVPVSPHEKQQEQDTGTASCVPPDPGGKEPEVARDEGNESKTTGQQQQQQEQEENVPLERCEVMKQD
ncbi:uncharacterized protein LOC126575090 [Anopheles aquasalis]|uniref:uncharacterized protein LOC126575090 n=1 Tax=Anopheles aquasalis TaxID=42839 RepID=UPI00215B6D3E|nr:uncharacterized protein LOC126575090 [Anopheles aquasalis]XP_050091584.1 uncharacterized protein LOC126575090 [Anopheles aquasalis]